MEILERVKLVLENQRIMFQSGKTRTIKFRREMLTRLLNAVEESECDILNALYRDLSKSEFESYASELAGVVEEIKGLRRNLRKWSKPRRVGVHINNFPASGRIYQEPYGSALIFSAWNYPFVLAMTPLAGAIAAGNCVALKPSDSAPATAAVIKSIIEKNFDPEYIAVFHGGKEAATALLAQPFDYIFYTGSAEIGKVVMKAAAEHLTPVTLELGGKSPCIVDSDANIELAAKRIVWGKFLNAGQTCVAPDYLFVHYTVKDKLLVQMRRHIKKFYGEDPAESDDYPRIINPRHCERLQKLLDTGNLVCGGEHSLDERYIAPTIIDGIGPDDALMQDEIFGPILPVMTFETIQEVIKFVVARPKPLAMYYFSARKKNLDLLLNQTQAGGMCVNETVTHLINPSMPFGGIGASGMGAYHGKYSFDTFSHYKPVMTKASWLDLPLRYPPFSKFKLKLLKLLTR